MGSVFGELDQFVFVVSNGPLAPVGAAQVVLPMQTLPLRVQVILPPGIRGVIDQLAAFEVGCLVDAVLQRAGIEGYIRIHSFGNLL